MSGGLARQLADRYPDLENKYSEYCRKHNNRFVDLSADIYYCQENNKIIANMFSQEENFDTNYIAMLYALMDIKQVAKGRNMSIAIPYGIGCGIAKGDWNKVYKIIEKVFVDYDVNLYKLEV